MDVEDEDDEGAESQNASADQDGLDTTMTSEGQEEENVEAKDEAGEQRDVFKKPEEHLESEEALELSWDWDTVTSYMNIRLSSIFSSKILKHM